MGDQLLGRTRIHTKSINIYSKFQYLSTYAHAFTIEFCVFESKESAEWIVVTIMVTKMVQSHWIEKIISDISIEFPTIARMLKRCSHRWLKFLMDVNIEDTSMKCYEWNKILFSIDSNEITHR